VSGFERAATREAEILDLAAFRMQRRLPPPRPTAREAEPPVGKQRGDRVRCRLTRQEGTVIGWRIERALGRGVPDFMLAIQFGTGCCCMMARDVETLSGPTLETDEDDEPAGEEDPDLADEAAQ